MKRVLTILALLLFCLSAYGKTVTTDQTTQPATKSDVSLSEFEPIDTSKSLLALKSNLLFDAASLINVEMEYSLSRKFSVAGELVFPWWTWDNGTESSLRHRLQLLQGGVDVKYWLGDRTKRERMTGWNVGLYCGAGKYDFEYDHEGYQGEFFIAAGLGCGFAHTINKCGNLRMEYALGIGYLKTDYRHYNAEFYGTDDWRAILTEKGTYSWFGPTKAKISLVWVLNKKSRRAGNE